MASQDEGTNFLAISNDEVRAMGIDPDEPDATRKLLSMITGRPLEEFTVKTSVVEDTCPTCGAKTEKTIHEYGTTYRALE